MFVELVIQPFDGTPKPLSTLVITTNNIWLAHLLATLNAQLILILNDTVIVVKADSIIFSLFLMHPETLVVLIGRFVELLKAFDLLVELMDVVEVVKPKVIIAGLLQDIEVELSVGGHS